MDAFESLSTPAKRSSTRRGPPDEDVHEANHPGDDLLVSRVGEVLDDRAILLPAKPRLSEVLVELVDDLRMVLGKLSSALQLQDGVIELLPELDATGSDLVDGLSELRKDGEDTAGRLGIGALPSSVIDTRRSDDEILDGRARVHLLGNHNARRKQEAIKGQELQTEMLDRLITSQVWLDVVGATEARASDSGYVALLADGRVC